MSYYAREKALEALRLTAEKYPRAVYVIEKLNLYEIEEYFKGNFFTPENCLMCDLYRENSSRCNGCPLARVDNNKFGIFHCVYHDTFKNVRTAYFALIRSDGISIESMHMLKVELMKALIDRWSDLTKLIANIEWDNIDWFDIRAKYHDGDYI